MKTRLELVAAFSSAALLLLVILLSLRALTEQPPAHADFRITQTPSPTPSATPTATPTAPVFSATLDIDVSSREVAIGDSLVVTLTLTVDEGCQYPIWEQTLFQTGPDGMPFAYVSPPTDTIPAPVPNPSIYILQAIEPGTAHFRGRDYGERNCGEGWLWTYVSSAQEIVRAGPWPHQVWLPLLSRPSEAENNQRDLKEIP